MSLRKMFCVSFLLVALATPLFAQPILRVETDQQKAERMKWWTEARFGMFIHWGLYALPARHEWVKNYEHITDEDYQKYFDNFNPDLFNPKEWARMAKAAGMKYFVITAKHHEGFCLWDSKFTDYKATKTPYGKDLLKQVVQAYRDEGLRVGFYYSLLDWHHPEYTVDRNHPMYTNEEFKKKAAGRDMSKYREYLFNQVREILTDFGTIDCLFLDYSFPKGKDGRGRADWDSEKLLKMVRELQPNIIVNDRLDLDDVKGGWDFKTPEQFIPRDWITVDGKKVPWETCQTFSDSWGYYRDEEGWKSPEQLVALLVETVSKGGNLLLNVGPTSRGTFDERAKNRLKEMGEWMKLHSRSIYGCTQAPPEFKAPENCLLTYNPESKRLYVHVLSWPLGNMFLNGFSGRIKYAQLLHDGSEVQFGKADRPFQNKLDNISTETVILKLPVKKPDVTVPVIEIVLR
jgi:alpha-L-fucosidase